jgi:glycosyltransferase involved in cell wall biosynthesis
LTLIIDGVYLQLQRKGSTRLWDSLLPLLAKKLAMPIVLLDRGNRHQTMPGVEVVPYPTYKSKFNTHDSVLLERICKYYEANAFVSTHFTTPLHTPSAFLVCDMIPERLNLGLGTREQHEKEVSIAHARRHVCVSTAIREDLLEFYPELGSAAIPVAGCGVDEQKFKPASDASIASFKSKYGLQRPYFLMFQSSRCNESYKNSTLLTETVDAMDNPDFDLLCVDASSLESSSILMSNGCRIVRAALDDESLAHAYSGAIALVNAALYEGLALSVAEAMACGCPVIVTSKGSSLELAQPSALSISGTSKTELAKAMHVVRDPAIRRSLSIAGVQRAAQFRWEPLADILTHAILQIAAEGQAGLYRKFYDKWAQLRAIQGDVDILP